MTDIDSMLDRILIDLLSDRIIERMNAKTRSALLLFSGTDIGLDAALGQLRQLRAGGWSFEAMRAPEALWLGNDRLAELNAKGAEGAIGDVLARNAMVLVPALSITLAAKVALGIADDPISALMQGAIERGSRILAARDGVCPGSRDRRDRGLLPTPVYRQTMSRHLQALADYGVELPWAARLAAAVEGTNKQNDAAPKATVATTIQETGVFGLREARGLDSAELHLGQGVLVTPAAAEELRARDIRLVRER
ncbi:hypothetical protein [Tianweitania sp.]|uniref:hypothetical protein n=1 Tax=Tianweitania sp. TaxID=2021634 RepID=UPI002896F5C1|nr:hypothetical protein [Tianweitania sp.]